MRAEAVGTGGTAVDARLGSGLNMKQASAHFRTAAAEIGISVTVNELLSRHTTFRIGGPADLFAAVSHRAQLHQVTALAAEYGLPMMVLGGGSNLLVSDAGIRGTGDRQPGPPDLGIGGWRAPSRDTGGSCSRFRGAARRACSMGNSRRMGRVGVGSQRPRYCRGRSDRKRRGARL